MVIKFTDTFRKNYKKADVRIKKSFQLRLDLFLRNPMYPLLRNHLLRGKYQGQRSIDVTANWRAIYREETNIDEDPIIYFTAIGTHNQLYN